MNFFAMAASFILAAVFFNNQLLAVPAQGQKVIEDAPSVDSPFLPEPFLQAKTQTADQTSQERPSSRLRDLLSKFQSEARRKEISSKDILEPSQGGAVLEIFIEEKLKSMGMKLEVLEGKKHRVYQLPRWVNLKFIERKLQRLWLQNYKVVSQLGSRDDLSLLLNVELKSDSSYMGPLSPIAKSLKLELVKDYPVKRACLIVDDMGHYSNGFPVYLSLPMPVGMSFLPFYDTTPSQSRKAAKNGFEVMLHLPMEPNHRFYFRSKYVVETDLEEEELRKRVQMNMKAIPDIVGFNNHQGSKATANEGVMDIVMQEASKFPGLFFVDSVTASNSWAYRKAREYNIPNRRRNSDFLDNQKSTKAVVGKIKGFIKHSLRTRIPRVAILHETKPSAKALASMIESFKEAGIELINPSELFKDMDLPNDGKDQVMLTPESKDEETVEAQVAPMPEYLRLK